MQKNTLCPEVATRKGVPLHVTCCSPAEFALFLSSRKTPILGVASYSKYSVRDPVFPAPFIHIPIAPVEGAILFELWTTDESVRYERHGPLQCGYNSTILFGCLTVDCCPEESLEFNTEQAYRLLFSHLDHSGYVNLLRIWHFISHITDDTNGLERYRAFNAGRYRAFSACRRDVKTAPAASALGSPEGPLAIYFIASRLPGLPLENKRQVSAYNYPKDYGPCSPIFSRAMQCNGYTFISGTASIVGHVSLYQGDLEEQTRETIANLCVLLINSGDGTLPSSGIQFKVYLRYPEHLPFVRNALAEKFGSQTPVAFFQAQICRRELLLEIEGTLDMTDKG